MSSITSLFKDAIKQDASDIHLIGDTVPVARIEGELVDLDSKPLKNKELETAIFSLLTKEQIKKYQDELELDFGMAVDDVRLRVNIHRQRDAIGLTARLIPASIPTPEDLHFEKPLLEFSNLLDGLVLITGPTGCGKSTTIASIIEEINKTRRTHVVTIEDPIEFVFDNKKSIIEQREVGSDTKSFGNALKYVLRQDPNIIFVGEMRDPETIATVLTAAETGHLVFSTLHTASAAKAIERIVDVFEGSKQKQILIQLSSVLRGVVAQQLIPSTDGGRVPAREILVNTPGVANLIRENSVSQIKSAIQTGARDGMVSMENSIKQLLKEGWIDKENAENRSGRARKI
jgi:twitching motility protein PilT